VTEAAGIAVTEEVVEAGSEREGSLGDEARPKGANSGRSAEVVKLIRAETRASEAARIAARIAGETRAKARVAEAARVEAGVTRVRVIGSGTVGAARLAGGSRA
jgi:hypothetical protein